MAKTQVILLCYSRRIQIYSKIYYIYTRQTDIKVTFCYSLFFKGFVMASKCLIATTRTVVGKKISPIFYTHKIQNFQIIIFFKCQSSILNHYCQNMNCITFIYRHEEKKAISVRNVRKTSFCLLCYAHSPSRFISLPF